MKIFISAVIVLLLGTGIGRAATPPPAPRPPVAEIKAGFIYVGPIGDAGWTYAHDQGRKAMARLPFVKLARYVESVPESGDATRVLTNFAQMGFNLIFATSYGYMNQTLQVAKKYPKVVFEHCSGDKVAANMSNYFGRMYQARYLTGIVAGEMTKSNLIGYVAAHPIPEVIRGINAFTLGARSVNPKAKVKVVWTYTWFDPAKEKQSAESLLAVGADVITQHQDSAGPQQAAQEEGKYSIGYNCDMSEFAPQAHLTAAVWNWEVVYRKIAEEVHNGTWTNRPIFWGLKTGLVDISSYGPMVPEKVKKDVEKARREIISGKKVFAGPIRDQEGRVIIPAGRAPTDRELFSMAYFVRGVEGKIPK